MVIERNNPLFSKVWIEKSVLAITDCHHSACLVMPIGGPRDGFFHPTLTLIIDFYIKYQVVF